MFRTRRQLQAWGYMWLAVFGALLLMLKLGVPWWLSIIVAGGPAAIPAAVLYRRRRVAMSVATKNG